MRQDCIGISNDCVTPAVLNKRPFRSFLLGSVFIALLTLSAYSSVFHAGFIWDDDAYVTENRQLNTADGLFSIWFSPGSTPQYYPMTFTVLWIEKHLWGSDAFGYHMVNILLHVSAALLIWICLGRIGVPAAFWAACIFAVHPVHVESVAWITELKNVLSANFYLTALLSYISFSGMRHAPSLSPSKRWAYYGLSLILFLLALFSKTVSGSLPAAILLIFWWRQGKFPWKETWYLAPFFVLAFVLGGQTARLEVHHVGAEGPEWNFSAIDRVLIAGRAVWFYMGKLFWPHPLIFNYPRWDINSGQWWQYLFPAGVVLLVSILWLTRRKTGLGPLAAVLFFIGTLFPALGFFNVFPMLYSFVADHFQYLASVGLIVLFCSAIDRLFQTQGLQKGPLEYLFYGSILLLLSVLAWHQGKTYENLEILYGDIIAKNPGRTMAHNNRGMWYQKNGKLEQAMADFNAAIALSPEKQPNAYTSRGILYGLKGQYGLAMKDFDQAIKQNAWFPDVYIGKGFILMERNELNAAIDAFSMAISVSPSNGDAHLNRGVAYERSGALALALADFGKAIAINPSDPLAYMNRAGVLWNIGETELAMKDYQKACDLGSDVGCRAVLAHEKRDVR